MEGTLDLYQIKILLRHVMAGGLVENLDYVI